MKHKNGWIVIAAVAGWMIGYLLFMWGLSIEPTTEFPIGWEVTPGDQVAAGLMLAGLLIARLAVARPVLRAIHRVRGHREADIVNELAELFGKVAIVTIAVTCLGLPVWTRIVAMGLISWILLAEMAAQKSGSEERIQELNFLGLSFTLPALIMVGVFVPRWIVGYIF